MHDKKHVTNCNNVDCAILLSSVKSHCHEEFHGQIWLQIKTSPHLIGGKKYVGNENVIVQILNSRFSDLKAALFLFFRESSRFVGYCGCQKFDLLSNQYQCAKNQFSRNTTEKQKNKTAPTKQRLLVRIRERGRTRLACRIWLQSLRADKEWFLCRRAQIRQTYTWFKKN